MELQAASSLSSACLSSLHPLSCQPALAGWLGSCLLPGGRPVALPHPTATQQQVPAVSAGVQLGLPAWEPLHGAARGAQEWRRATVEEGYRARQPSASRQLPTPSMQPPSQQNPSLCGWQ